jgi:PTH1 family peptidyl-tRNA hydrolase
MYVIVGLGNPGRKYDATRHNVGFNVIDMLSEKLDIKVDKLKYKSLNGEGRYKGEKIVLVKPQTFMNLSGQSVVGIVNYFDVPMEKLIVIYDDIDTELGKIRIRKKGSSGSHNGMKNIIYLLGKDDFPRVRIGVGKPVNMNLADYVLSRFKKEEMIDVINGLEKARDSIIEILDTDIDKAMNKFNG